MTNTFIAVSRPTFPLGHVAITANALAMLDPTAIQHGLSRHAAADWGELCTEDRHANASALRHGGRLFSVYGRKRERFWIITEADRTVTTVLLPLDY